MATSRIIPALAGNTCRERPPCAQGRDHPRSRGEYADGPIEAYSTIGIIPALAGNTLMPTGFRGFPRDHPRSRGEYTDSRADSARYSGSSPLSRGIH